jgi:hypothetical protein
MFFQSLTILWDIINNFQNYIIIYNIMKSRILRKNVRQSIRRSQSGGGKTYEFKFRITTNIFRKKFGWEGDSYIRLKITVKKPKEKSILSKERKEYLFDVKVYSDPLIERFARFNKKKNLTSNELVLLFFENYNSADIVEVEFIRKLIAELRFTEDVGSWDAYSEGLYFLFTGLKKKTLEAEKYATDAKKKEG